jgi:lysyl-tRNA synthetase class 2
MLRHIQSFVGSQQKVTTLWTQPPTGVRMFFEQSHSISEANYVEVGREVSIAGRVVSYRKLGGIAFGYMQNAFGKMQFAFRKDLLGEKFLQWAPKVHIGVHIGVKGKIWISSTNEKTVLVEEFVLLNKPVSTFPDKWNGIVDVETKRRKRFLDIIVDEDTRRVMNTRIKLMSAIRTVLRRNEYVEVETPILSTIASGAHAKPFSTHHNALDAEMFMRIAPETYLKRAVAAGYEKVFEMGKVFRNEGIDPSHLQEFTSLEWYTAYFDYRDNLRFFIEFFDDVIAESGIEVPESLRDLSQAPVLDYRELFYSYANVYPETMSSAEADLIFKTRVRPNLKGAMFVIDYPAHMSPMAARNGDIAQQWQLIVDGWELVKCYTELTDPVIQRELLEEQMNEKMNGNDEAMPLEEDFLEAMEYGMPPMSGLGLGIDRLVSILCEVDNLRDCILFPMHLK